MEQQIKEIISRIDTLEKLINVIQQNLNSNIQSFLACLALIVATSGVALVYYVKSTVNKRVEKELAIIKENLKNDLEKYIDKNPHMRYQMGIMTGSYVKTDFSIAVANINNDTIGYPNRLELFTTKSGKVLKYDANVIKKNGNCEIVIKLYNFDANTDGDLRWMLSEYISN